MNRLMLFAGGLGLGAGLEYVLDPDRGRRRRAIARDKLAHAARVAKDGFIVAARDGVNRSIGALASLRSAVEAGPPSDDVLEARVRSHLGRACSNAHAISVRSRDGCVTLEGHVPQDEVAALIACVRSTRGVREIRNGLQADRRRASPHDQGLHAWRPSTRLAALLAGTACCLAAFGFRSRGTPVWGGLGVYLLGRVIADPGVGRGRPARAASPRAARVKAR